ncbi:MAG TPA: hypothetical protein VG960_04520 [Caulobacteraceae bacterium]|nr:hypothetical protein [Caulobacteraceae bacterium]
MSSFSLECASQGGSSKMIEGGKSTVVQIPNFIESVEISENGVARVYPKEIPQTSADARFLYKAETTPEKIFLTNQWNDPDAKVATESIVIDRATGRFSGSVHSEWIDGNIRDASYFGVCNASSSERKF